ncbi:class Ib ribonucleoside-diphosphate reductase assembly flavoprotein NrdI [Ligilactobacillus equi]|uniref:Ribonucleotide reductase stimulatory protein n=2 Tax=Ligilactobacillus equi TaxID=137357 RepID=V7I088_9LACO|nr:class Ib ribonucleoside-diphosphate reductase assembly flavoprotein NrdI [Ligilactobacillus equi]ETA74701.1 ribonucleotide reductase stimulatory protein [Ligilactobacillus equi DPC 6820]KRL84953.1 ribonucleotide reductase stimulatory protein [Ligilactobacillus equi DSM 15833 = JCM 10991]MCQ2557226.1 class Ib ribonucleoside-diphosphate reductase assembly flavoprotein NrdI [Ligilactobacillus sp.]
MKIVYFTVTGQTRRFIKKLGSEFESYEINPASEFPEITEPFVLITPTYEDAITEPVRDFLDYAENANYLKGIVGTGNRNFAQLFIFTAKDLAEEYDTPIIYAFEFNGTSKDVSNFKKAVKKLES